MAAQREPAFEAQEQVLADRLDPLEPLPVEPLGDVQYRGARMRGLHLEPLAHQGLQIPRYAVDAVAFGHRSDESRR